jgi:hypothetical protein
MAMQGSDLESTILAATWAAHFLAKGRNSCKTLAGAYSMYGTGRSCHLKSSAKRAAYAADILSEIRRRRP